MKFARFIAVALVASLVGLVACSSDDSSSAASSCAEAKKVADSCNSQPQDGGASVTVTFDQAKCESGGDQAKKAADCIVANKGNCDCPLKCSLTGSCS
jgi:hypothetical protein